MKIKNQRLYNIWIRDNTEDYQRAALRWAIGVANQVEASMDNGQNIQDAFRDARLGPHPEGGLTPLMEYLGIRFLIQAWHYGDQITYVPQRPGATARDPRGVLY